MNAELEHVLDPGYLDDLEQRPIDEIRAMRAECQAIETGLSYLRRLIQGRLDLIATEARSRDDGSPGASLAELIDRLPSILADHTRAGGVGRLPSSLGTGDVDPDLQAEFDAILTPSESGTIDHLDAERLAEAADRLSDLEQRVSARRRELFDRLDALQAEIARRYRTGEADVESLLS